MTCIVRIVFGDICVILSLVSTMATEAGTCLQTCLQIKTDPRFVTSWHWRECHAWQVLKYKAVLLQITGLKSWLPPAQGHYVKLDVSLSSVTWSPVLVIFYLVCGFSLSLSALLCIARWHQRQHRKPSSIKGWAHCCTWHDNTSSFILLIAFSSWSYLSICLLSTHLLRW